MNRLILIGASGHGKVCAEIAKLSGNYNEILFLDDDISIKKCGDYEVVGTSEDYTRYIENAHFHISIGDASDRRNSKDIYEREIKDITDKNN